MIIPSLYCDEDILVCVKPVGISSESPGLPDLLYEQTGFRLWPVHRLDHGTGGVVVLARSRKSCSAMQRLFSQNLVCKEYLSVIAGRPPEDSGHYEDLLYHDKRTNKTFIVNRFRNGVKKAVCDWKIHESADFKGQTVSLVRIFLQTGRTHQIRIQFGSRRFPLVGDRKYGSRIKADAPALWASCISFPHPAKKGTTVHVSAEPPSVFPWNLFLSDYL